MTKTKQEISDFINGSLSSLVVIEDKNNQVNVSLNGKVTDVIYLIARCIEDVSEHMDTTPEEIAILILARLHGTSNLDNGG